MRATEMVQVAMVSTRRHRDKALAVINMVVTNSLVIPPEITECLNKSEWKQIKSLLGKTQPALYYAWGEDYNNNPKKAGQLDPLRMLDSE
jgi:hypothetical protein